MKKNNLAETLAKRIDGFLEKRKSIDVQINSLLKQKKSIDAKIINSNNTYIDITGKSYKGIDEFRTAADLAEDLLREFGELHVDQILELIKTRKLAGNREIPKQSMVATLVRYAQSNKKFERVKNSPNTFKLIDERKGGVIKKK